jgi:tetratricopeptide (TPR) repeat protein
MPLAAGTKLGPYEIVSLLGAGGMGEVYRARDTRLGRDVAVKVLQESLAGGTATWERFEREARAASALNHPNICAVFDVGEADSRPYLVMELLEGQTLRGYTGGKRVDPAAAIALATQVADALEAAHAKGVIHRDIKSGNIMVTGRRHVKVLDFGLAKYTAPVTASEDTPTMQSLTAAGTVMGTPHYMAPEILQGKPADARSDLWALGVVLHEMLTGVLPFQGSTAFEISSAILRGAPPPLPASAPSGLRTIVERCLAKRPEDRYQSAGEVRAALEALQASAGPNRRSWLWAAAAGLVLALAAGGVFEFRKSQPGGRRLSTGGPPSANQEANELFELALSVQRQQNDIPRGLTLLARALALDPNFAEAHRYHAFNYVIQIMNGYVNDRGLVYRAEEELNEASRLDPNLESLPSAYMAVYMLQGRKDDLGRVEAQAQRVLEKNPAQNDTRLWRAMLLWLSGDNPRAKEELNGMLEREPLFGAPRLFLGEALRLDGDLPGAIREQKKLLEQAPGNISAIRYLALAYMQGGQLDEARALLEQKRPLFVGNYMWRGTWAFLLALEGKRAEALRTMDEETLKFFDAAIVVTLGAAEFYAVAGDKSKAIEWLDKAVRNGDERAEWLRKDPWLASIRQDPNFERILGSIEARRKQK